MAGLGEVDFEDIMAATSTASRGTDMTCRFEIEFAGKEPYPRSCPTCGISGKCHKDYRQVKLTDEQRAKLGFGYVIVDPSGKPEASKAAKWNELGTGIPSQLITHHIKPGDLRHENALGVGTRPYPGSPDLTQEVAEKLERERRANEAVTAAAKKPFTRVQRAQCLDILDELPDIHTEAVLNSTLDKLLAVISGNT